METSFCDEGHEICWAQVNGKRTAMVAVGPAFCLDEGLNATPIGPCFVQHAQMCGSKRFMPVRKLLLEMQERSPRRARRAQRRKERREKEWSVVTQPSWVRGQWSEED